MSSPRAPAEPLGCSHCGEPIGIYEPMVALSDGVPLLTSPLALEAEDPSGCFHVRCFAEVEDA